MYFVVIERDKHVNHHNFRIDDNHPSLIINDNPALDPNYAQDPYPIPTAASQLISRPNDILMSSTLEVFSDSPSPKSAGPSLQLRYCSPGSHLDIKT